MTALLAQVCSDEVNPEEAAKVATLIDGQRRLFETEELERCIRHLESASERYR